MKLPIGFQYTALLGKTVENLEQPNPDREGVVRTLLEILAGIEDNTQLTKSSKDELRRLYRGAIDDISRGNIHQVITRDGSGIR